MKLQPLLFVLFLSLYSVGIKAEIKGTIYIPDLTVYANPENTLESDSAVLDLHLGVKVWTLLGEPVYMCTGWWELKSVQVAGTRFFAEQNSYNPLPSDISSKIHIWDSRFQIPLKSPNDTAYLHCGAGEFWAQGVKRPSFNVPDSVGWNSLLFSAADGASDGVVRNINKQELDFFAQAIPSEKAKAIVANTNTKIVDNASVERFNHSNVLQLKINLSAVYEWYINRQGTKRKQLSNTLQQQKQVKPKSLDDIFEAVDTKRKIAEAEQSAKTIKAFLSGDVEKQSKQQKQYALNIKNARCANNALSPKVDMALLDFIQKQQATTLDCLSVKNLFPKQDKTSRLWGYVTDKGDWYIKPQFNYAKPFGDGLAPVQPKGKDKFGYVNTSGELVIPAKYRFADPFRNNRAIVSDRKGHYGVIDANDKIIIPIKWYTIQLAYGDNYFVKTKRVEEVLSSETVRIACRLNRKEQGWKNIRVKKTAISYQYGELDRNNKWVKKLSTDRIVKEDKPWSGWTNC